MSLRPLTRRQDYAIDAVRRGKGQLAPLVTLRQLEARGLITLSIYRWTEHGVPERWLTSLTAAGYKEAERITKRGAA